MKNKENFYVFLDIDGVLWDWPWRIEQIKNGNFKSACSINNYKPESVQALNTLLDYLGNDYNCNLVISSSWRRAMRYTIENLKKNNIHLPYVISRTDTSNKPIGRGERILAYLKNKTNSNNFLILDDQNRDFQKFFAPKKLIKTNIYSHSLSLSHIQKWIDQKENDDKKFDKIPNIL